MERLESMGWVPGLGSRIWVGGNRLPPSARGGTKVQSVGNVGWPSEMHYQLLVVRYGGADAVGISLD